MFCEKCKKRKATIHLTEIVDGEMTELHICEDCAKSEGAEIQQHFSIANLLSGLVDLPQGITPHKEHVRVRCPSCGMNYSDFKRLGRFGCARCYEAFRRALNPLLKRIHGSTRHIGKEPGVTPLKRVKPVKGRVEVKPRVDGLEELKRRLVKAIELEEFEEAAVLRDKIRLLEKKK